MQIVSAAVRGDFFFKVQRSVGKREYADSVGGCAGRFFFSKSRGPSLRPGLLFIIRVKRELKRVYRNGCRYNERLNDETGGSKTPRTHWVARVNI
jgi:hypothetical protein